MDKYDIFCLFLYTIGILFLGYLLACTLLIRGFDILHPLGG